MKVTVLDTQTGNTAHSIGISSFQWAEGDWSCDCNRELMFDVDGIDDWCCRGSHRFIVTSAECESDYEPHYSLAEINEDYPEELLIKHGILTVTD